MSNGNYYVYITTNPGKTILYTGVTNDLKRRLLQHYQNRGNKKSFAGKYYCYKLIYYEFYGDIHQAIAREKEIKDLKQEKERRTHSNKESRMEFFWLYSVIFTKV